MVGKGSMIMLVVDGNGMALNREVESALAHEGHLAKQTVVGIKVKNIHYIAKVVNKT